MTSSLLVKDDRKLQLLESRLGAQSNTKFAAIIPQNLTYKNNYDVDLTDNKIASSSTPSTLNTQSTVVDCVNSINTTPSIAVHVSNNLQFQHELVEENNQIIRLDSSSASNSCASVSNDPKSTNYKAEIKGLEGNCSKRNSICPEKTSPPNKRKRSQPPELVQTIDYENIIETSPDNQGN